MTPKQKERLEAKIKAIKAELAADKKRWGGYYDDSRGFRYAPPSLYVQLRDFSGGLKYYNWFEKNFSNDVAYIDFSLDSSLILFKSNKSKLAEKLVFKAFYYQKLSHENTFVCEVILPEGKQVSTFFAELIFADYINFLSKEPDLLDFLVWLKSFIQSENFVTAGNKIVEFEKKIKSTPISALRKKLTDEQKAIFDGFK